MEFTFDDLLQDSERLLMEVQGDSELPHITRGFGYMRQFGEKVYFPRGSRQDIKAARLLGSKMIYDIPEHLASKLESLTDADVIDAAPPPAPSIDIQSFLKSERENALLKIISLTQKSTLEEAEARCDRYLHSWWEQEAAGILSSLASSSGPVDTDLLHFQVDPETPKAGVGSRVFELSGDVGRNSVASRTREELVYAKQLDNYLGLHRPLSKTTSSISYYSPSQVVKSPDDLLINYLCSHNSSSTGGSGGAGANSFSSPSRRPRFGQSTFAELWSLLGHFVNHQGVQRALFAPCTSDVRSLELRAASGLQNALVTAGLEYLELEFAEYLRVTVASQPRLARLGGRPGTRALVKAFLTVTLPSAGDEGGDVSLRSASPQVVASHEQQQQMVFEDGLVDGKPVWPMIYCCLRAGDPQTAIEVARAASNNLDNFASVLADFIDGGRCLGPRLQPRVRQNYLQIVKSTRDPYKCLVYSILGSCELTDSHSDVIHSIDDFLWLKLSQVAACAGDTALALGNSRLGEEEDEEETLTLGQLQMLLSETYGEAHFDAWSQPLVYCKLLCLTQQFEAVVGFLARFEGLRCHAVHMALGLHDANLLLLTDSLQAPLVCRYTHDPTGFRRLNLARLILLYTRKFESVEPAEALVYFYFLGNLSTSSLHDDGDCDNEGEGVTNATDLRLLSKASRGGHRNLFFTSVCELALSTKEFDLLLGSVTDSCTRKPGAIDRYCHQPEDRQTLVASTAQVAESRGQIMAAIKLYQLAAVACDHSRGNRGQRQYYRRAAGLMNQLLAAVVAPEDATGKPPGGAQFPGHGSGQLDRTLLLRMATELAHRLRFTDSLVWDKTLHSEAAADPGDEGGGGFSSSQTLFYLLDLATFFDLVSGQRWQAAIDHIDQLNLLPSSNVESHVTAFEQLPDLLRRALPAAMLALMRCLVAKFSQQKAAQATTGSITGVHHADVSLPSSDLSLADVRTRARALITFVGRIPYRLPGDVYARLTQMDMEIF